MIKPITVIAFLLSVSFGSLAQTTDKAAGELTSTPPALTEAPARPESPAKEINNATFPLRLRYGLSAGTQFSRFGGTATFLEPSVLFPVSQRFSGFASLTMMTTFNNRNFLAGNETFTNNYGLPGQARLLLHAGGDYLVTDRLNLTGSVWRDLSNNQLSAPLNLYLPGGSSGLSLRAHYKVTENLSVSGGIRYSNGRAYTNQLYNTALPWGY